jgi:diguanylate cyclase (GGDEF)-like protein
MNDNMSFTRKMVNELAKLFTLTEYRDKKYDYARDEVGFRIASENVLRIYPVCLVTIIAQFIYVTSDLYFGYYSVIDLRTAIAISAEVLLIVSSCIFVPISAMWYNKNASVKQLRAIYLTYYSIFYVGLLLFMACDMVDKRNPFTLFFLIIIYSFVPLFWGCENLVFFVLKGGALTATIFVTDGLRARDFVQMVLLFIICEIISLVLRVKNLSNYYNEIEARRLNNELDHASRLDPLTGLPNRRYFDTFIAENMEQWQEKSENFAIAMCDIDFFKNFNDTYSHIEGDKALVLISGAIKAVVENTKSGNASVARIGGEEFLLTYEGWREIDEVVDLFVDIKEKVEHLRIPSGNGSTREFITISIGVVTTSITKGSDIHLLLKKADKRLYEAKEAGKNMVIIDGHQFS